MSNIEAILESYIQHSDVDKQKSNERRKVMAVLEEKKDVIRQYMVSSSLKFIASEQGQYIVLKDKKVKPTLNSDSLKAILFRFLQGQGWEVSEAVWAKYEACRNAFNTEMGSTKLEVVLTTSRPVETFYSS